ncbi:MAG TPA: hypothetical protein VMT23_04115 [Candidatus Binatia bacterium]|nr:hypothetical protein [Candidatus Binatia bacterium]
MRAVAVAENLPDFVEPLAAVSYVSLPVARESVEDGEKSLDFQINAIKTWKTSTVHDVGGYGQQDVISYYRWWREDLATSIGAVSLVSERVDELSERQKQTAGRLTKGLGRWTVSQCFEKLCDDDIAAQESQYRRLMPLLSPFGRAVLAGRLQRGSIQSSVHLGDVFHMPDRSKTRDYWVDDSFWLMFHRTKQRIKGAAIPEDNCPTILANNANADQTAEDLIDAVKSGDQARIDEVIAGISGVPESELTLFNRLAEPQYQPLQ